MKLKPRPAILLPAPFAGGLFATGSMGTVAIVAGVVLVTLAILACVLILSGGVAPVLEWGKLKLGFVPLRGSTPQDDAAAERPPPDRDPVVSSADRRSLRERVLSCGRGRAPGVSSPPARRD